MGMGVGGTEVSVAVGIGVFVGFGVDVVEQVVFVGIGVAVAASAPPLHARIINTTNNINTTCLKLFFCFIEFSFHISDMTCISKLMFAKTTCNLITRQYN